LLPGRFYITIFERTQTMANQTKRRLAWLGVALCSLSIYLIIPVARTIQRFVSAHWGRALFGYVVIAATVISFCVLAFVLFSRLKIRAFSNYAWLALVAAGYISFTLRLWKSPEVAIHFLEYGLLGYFLFRALSFSFKDAGIYLAAFFIGSLIGAFDEIIQWIVPGRYWDLQDVGLNALSGALFQIALWKGVKPKFISGRIGPKSLKKVSVLFGANLILLGLCLSNTPQVVNWAARRIPALGFLEKEEAMSEFRYKHRDPEVGVFYSRLNLEDLKRLDEGRAEEYGRLLWEWKEKNYDDFLHSFTGSTHPLMYEIRIHIFRRDRKYEDASQAQTERERRGLLLIAYKENLIIEKYYGRTLQKSPYLWPEGKKSRLAAQVDKRVFYKSPVSSGVFATLKGKTMWVAIGFILVILVLSNVLGPARKPPEADN
jgi:hypothetical protein